MTTTPSSRIPIFRLASKALRRRAPWPFGIYRVAGESMLPTLPPGSMLIGYRWGRPRAGRIAVVSLERHYVKRLVRREAGGWWIEGDNGAMSHDSRAFGAVAPQAIEAIIVWPWK